MGYYKLGSSEQGYKYKIRLEYGGIIYFIFDIILSGSNVTSFDISSELQKSYQDIFSGSH